MNRPNGPPPSPVYPRTSSPSLDLSTPPRRDHAAAPIELGPGGVRSRAAGQAALAVTDTTFRDAHQSLLATRVRTIGVAGGRRACRAAHPGVAVDRGLGRRDLRRGAAVPARRPVGAPGRAPRGGAEHLPADAAARPQHRRLHPYPESVTRLRRRGSHHRESTSSGSSTRSTTSTRCGPRQSTPFVTPAPPVAEVALCYTGDLSNPGETLYTLDYYLRLAEQIVMPARTSWRSRTWPGCCEPRRPRRWWPHSEKLRPAGPPAHPRHPRWPASDLPGGVAGRRGRRRRRVAGHGGHHQPAAAIGDRRRHRHTDRGPA